MQINAATTKQKQHRNKTTKSHIRFSKYFEDNTKKNILTQSINLLESHDSSVGIALGYGLDDRGSRVRFPAKAGNFSLHHRIQKGPGAHPPSYPMGTKCSFPGGKAAGT
jgi:hypothetical protein